MKAGNKEQEGSAEINELGYAFLVYENDKVNVEFIDALQYVKLYELVPRLN